MTRPTIISEKYDLSQQTNHLNNSLINGLTPSSLTDATINMPVANMQSKDGMLNKEIKFLQTAGSIQGLHAPIRFATERTLVSFARRLPPLKSSMLSLELLLDQEDTLEFSDYLNVECPKEALKNDESIHRLIEKRLGYEF